MQPNDFAAEIPANRKVELGLMFSQTCNITCRHCGIFSSPYNKNKMRLDDARCWIMEAAHIPNIKQINFTGGEPFLFQDELADLLQLSRSLGFGTRVVTNGFWARTVDAGMKVLSRMKEAGLCELNFSADSFHLEFLPAETLRNALECARQLDYCRIVSFVTNSDKEPLEDFCSLYGIQLSDVRQLIPSEIIPLLRNPETERAVKSKILVYYGQLIGLGRAAEYPKDLRWFPVDVHLDGGCREIVSKPVIYPDGDLQACCCAGGKMSPFTVGNLHRESLKTLIGRMFNRSHFQFITTEGPKALFKLVATVRPDLSREHQYTSVCEMCVRAADGLSPAELDEIANYGQLKRFFDVFAADLVKTSPTQPDAKGLLSRKDNS